MQLLASLIGMIFSGPWFLDMMCSWRTCHVVALSHGIGALDYWDVGLKTSNVCVQVVKSDI